MSWLDDIGDWVGGLFGGDTTPAPASMPTQGLAAQPVQPPDPYAAAFGPQPPHWAQALQLAGATLRDVGNLGRTNNVGLLQAAMQKQALQRAQMAAGQRVANSMLPDFAPVNVTPQITQAAAPGQPNQNAGIDLGGTVTRPSASDILSSIAQGIPQGVNPKPYLELLKAGQIEYGTDPRFDQNGNGYVIGKDGLPKYLPGIRQPVDPNKPFTLGPDGTPVANTGFQDYEADKARRGARDLVEAEKTNKWAIYNDPANNTPFRYNPDLAQSTTLAGAPYTPSGLARLALPKPSTSPDALPPGSDPIVQSWASNVLNGNATMQQVPAAYRNAVSLKITDAPQAAYSPLAALRFTNAANRIVSNFTKLPQYELTANGVPYLQRIDAAMKNSGSISDQDLLDSFTKLNTSGNAISDAQVRLITDGKSLSDWAGTIANKFKNGGVLSDNQRQQIQKIAKAIYANYQKGYQPVYDQVTKKLSDAGIPKAFWTIPDLNNLSAEAQGSPEASPQGAPAGGGNGKIRVFNPATGKLE